LQVTLDRVVSRRRLPYNNYAHSGCLAFSPNGKLLAVSRYNTVIELWDISTLKAKLVAIFEGHTDLVCSIAFAPDGFTLASASYDKMVRLWDIPNRKLRTELKFHRGVVSTVAISRNGKHLASGSWDRTVRLWDITESQPKVLATLTGNFPVTSIAFSVDGNTLAVGSGTEDGGGEVALWDVETGQERFVFSNEPGLVTCVEFAPDGQMLVNASRGTGPKEHTPEFPCMVRFAASENDVLRYHERIAGSAPENDELQINLAIACWGSYLHLQRGRGTSNDRGEIQRILELGRSILSRLEEASKLNDQQSRWIGEFTKAIQENSSEQ
jgi:WD40 repeat protein